MEDWGTGFMKTVGKVFLGLVIIVVFVGIWWCVSIGNFLSKSREARLEAYATEYCDLALIPDLKPFVERFEEGIYTDGSYDDKHTALETKKYKSVDALCEAFPSGYTKAIKETVSKGIFCEASDLDGKTADRYEIKDSLPFADPEDITENYREQSKAVFKHFYILKYGNGSCRLGFTVHKEPYKISKKDQTIYLYKDDYDFKNLDDFSYFEIPELEDKYSEGSIVEITGDIDYMEGGEIFISSTVALLKSHKEITLDDLPEDLRRSAEILIEDKAERCVLEGDITDSDIDP
ncbi:MAG: hypothetical protein J6X33_02420 [Clostridiales bacterium]|nr:hypothetical protein [Clostridiales bacterium]